MKTSIWRSNIFHVLEDEKVILSNEIKTYIAQDTPTVCQVRDPKTLHNSSEKYIATTQTDGSRRY